MRELLISLSALVDGDYVLMKEYISKSDFEIKTNSCFIQYLNDNNINVLTILDQEYPNCLKHLTNPPYVLYYRGNINLLQQSCIGIIGTRRPTAYGLEVTQQLVSQLPKHQVVVSGLAKGIDGSVHKHCIKSNIKTIGVIGSGFNHFYPKENEYLSKEVHLLISEYPPDVKPLGKHFPMRNRIVAALSEKLIIVEAKSKSGTMITCEIANELGKDIYCIPGSILSENSRGCHQLIEDGAKILKDFDDLL